MKKTFKLLSSFVINASIWMHKAFNLVTHCLMSKKDIENSLSLKTKASKSLRSTSIFVPYFCIMRRTLNPMPEYTDCVTMVLWLILTFDIYAMAQSNIYIYSNNEYDRHWIKCSRYLNKTVWKREKNRRKTILLSSPSPKINFRCCMLYCSVLCFIK